MKNLKIAIASVLTTSVLFSGSVFATIGTANETGTNDADIQENDEVTLGFNHPQSLSVSSPNNVTNRSSNGIINRTWHVVSNNAVTIKMTGRSPDATGTIVQAPTFYKAEVGSDSKILTDRFDHLTTTFGATIEGYEDITGAAKFGNGAVAAADAIGGNSSAQVDGQDSTNDYASVLTGTPDTLVGTGANSVYDTFKTIMPADNGRFKMTLSAKGVGDVATTQSGDYQITVVASFMANEQGNAQTVVASTAESSDPDGFLTDTQTYETTDVGGTNSDNTSWNTTTSTAVDDSTEQSAVVISGADTKADNAAAY